MTRALFAFASVLVLGSVLLFAQAPQGRGQRGQPADPPNAVFWSAEQIGQSAAELKARVNAQTHNAATALIPSVNLIYRDGDSGSEIHEKVADVIFVHEGEGAIVVGGKMIGGQQDRPDEIRGTAI